MNKKILAAVIISSLSAGAWAGNKHNVIENPNFDQHGQGWSYWFANASSDQVFKGEYRARIAIGKDHHVTQQVTIPESGYYSLKAHTIVPGKDARMGIANLAGEELYTTRLKSGKNYKQNKLKKIPLEEGQVVEVFFTGSDAGAVSVDAVTLKREKKIKHGLNQVIGFEVEHQRGDTIIHPERKTVQVSVPYATDVTNLMITENNISKGSRSTLQEGDMVDFTRPVKMVLTDSKGRKQTWRVEVVVKEKEVTVTSSNQELEESFNWAIDKTKQFVMTGRNDLVNRDENNNDGTGRADYLPSYWAGYFDRTAFYSRDFLHQASGAKLAGLDEENLSMFRIFANHSTESRKWYTLWAVNFDGTPHTIDYKDDSWFVREVPAQFEFVEKAYQQYLWTGDERYINDLALWQFYTKVLTDYIELHDDQDPNGIAEGYGGIFEGSATYNERGEFPIEAGDGIGSQYQATVAYAAMLKARGESGEAAIWQHKADKLKTYFNEEWSIKDPSQPLDNYVNIVQKDGLRLNDFGKENSWFMPMKRITDPGERNDRYLDFISEKLGDGIGSNPDAPNNIEAYTYIPETFFPYFRNEEAWKWMQYIIDRKDLPHERPTQGTNGDYPEISYTFISNTVEGLMGVRPDAANDRVTTTSHLPSDIKWLEVNYLQVGEHELKVRHDGLNKTVLTNQGEETIHWQARFYGSYDQLTVDGRAVDAKRVTQYGVEYSAAEVDVAPGEEVTVTTR